MTAPTESRLAKREALRTPRAAAVAGILFAILLTAAVVLVRVAIPKRDELGSWVNDDSKRGFVLFALNLLPFAGIAFLWFIGVIRDRIGAGEDRLFATVFLGSGLLFVAMMFVGAALAGGMIAAVGEREVDTGLLDLWSFARRSTLTLITVYAMRMAAVFTMSTTTLAMRLGVVPRWLAVYGYVTAIVLLLTSGSVPWLELVFPLWVFVLSVHMLIATRRGGATSTAPG